MTEKRCKIIIDASETNIVNLVCDIKRIIDIYKYDAKVDYYKSDL